MEADAISPDAMAKRYDGIGIGWCDVYARVPASSLDFPAMNSWVPVGRPEVRTGRGERILISKGDLTAGVSWQGYRERA